MRATRFPACRIAVGLLTAAACMATLAGTALAEEKTPPRKNSWVFAPVNKPVPPGWLFVTIQSENGHWVIASLAKTVPEKIARQSPQEPFIVSPDFQRWANYYTDNIGNCDSFAVQDSPFKNVCFSQFAGKNQSRALVGMLFGGNGVAGHRYDVDLVNAAIGDIDPEDALRRLEKIERGD